MRIITSIIALLLITEGTATLAQENLLDNGRKTGHWVHKDADGLIYAEGNYNNNSKEGLWKFYISTTSRKQHQPDVLGTYSKSGMKQGEWVYSNSHSNINVSVHFDNDLMQGECIYYDVHQNIIARGLMQDGIRHGKWIFYDKNNPTGAYHQNGFKLCNEMTQGYYKDGMRIGQWNYDYYLDKNTHVKGQLSFDNGGNTGRLDFYKVEDHPKFGRTEFLAGSGSFTNGKKTGRWIEFNYGTKGDFIETGNYDSDGERDGHWKIRIGNQTFLAGTYNHGIPHGRFNHYYESGNIKYQSTYNNGLEEGDFKSFFKNGQVQEQGTNVIISDEISKDTSYFSLKLPYEHHFLLIEEDFVNMNYDYISWLHEPGYSINPAELSRRFNVYRSYGFEANRRITNITISDKKTVRQGDYMAFYKDGGLQLKGNHSPQKTSLYDPNSRSISLDFAREGEWKEYDKNHHLKNTYIYENGKLKKMLDANGYIVHTFQYEQSGLVNIIDVDGNTVSSDTRK